MKYQEVLEMYKKYLRTPYGDFDGKQRCPLKESSFKKMVQIHDKYNGENTNTIFNKLLLENRNVYVWSDQHFNHNNIIKYCNRPFVDSFDMNYKLKQNYTDLIKDDDVVIFVGDLAMGDITKITNFLNEFKGIKILVLGNHDIDRDQHIKNLMHFFDYVTMCLSFSLDNKHYVVTHYPIDKNLLYQSKNIHGHIHDNDSPSEKHINVSVEKTDYKPILMKSILK